MTTLYDFRAPDRVTVGTSGPVGQRLFVIQAAERGTVVTVKVEKIQAARLATFLGRMLQELQRPGELEPAPDLAGFDEPDIVATSLELSYDETADRVVLVVSDRDPADDEEDTDGTARFAMTREQAAALAIRATELVESGRPPCPLCGYPLDPRGHACPRTNGHTAPLT